MFTCLENPKNDLFPKYSKPYRCVITSPKSIQLSSSDGYGMDNRRRFSLIVAWSTVLREEAANLAIRRQRKGWMSRTSTMCLATPT